jgi:hypothetical protein
LALFLPITVKMLERAVEASHVYEPASDIGQFASQIPGLARVLE